MNSDISEGAWKRLKGDVRAQWGELNDDELEQAKGNSEKMIGLIQQKTGEARGDIERKLKELSDD